MKKTKLEKGITLIALIITIVVLLILAIVTMGVVKGNGIIGHAQNAASDYKIKADEENTILEGYLATIEENIPGEEESEPVSIVGKYGNDNENYYIFSENGIGKHVENTHGSLGVVEENFTYTLTNSSGTIIMEDNEEKSYTFYAAKDSSGTVVNRFVSVEEWGDGTFLAYTTNGNVGLPNLDGTSYNEVEGDDRIETVSLENGKCIVKFKEYNEGINDDEEDYGYYFTLGDYIYILEEEQNIYFSYFQIIGNKLKELAS